MDDRILDRLLAATESQARAASALVEINRSTDGRLVRIEESQARSAEVLTGLLREMEVLGESRVAAVNEIKSHATLVIAKSERWWKLFGVLIGLFLAVSQLLGTFAATLVAHGR